MLELVRRGGVVFYDNMLWRGSIVMPIYSVPLPEMRRASMDAKIEFNTYLDADTHVHISQAPRGDGITVCQRL
ncbi:probable caffeoyl-coa o-methyltransferase at4g26220 [Phtheirospermum japonicum]|uniref:Probable caffeoyl-coa o-methyltransferase at4g26220 n=1 Tax=Phtheirospermum japonicum TaxID=374723 RepID=A0A830BCT6_9LAMI|nr:probable caffeoyl-coa o-methyltransferase at4g26220 [Phtheirospermum japonicum]